MSWLHDLRRALSSDETSASEGGLGRFMLWLELDQRNLLLGETFIADPLSVDLLSQEVESCLSQSGADPMEPEVTARLAENCLK